MSLVLEFFTKNCNNLLKCTQQWVAMQTTALPLCPLMSNHHDQYDNLWIRLNFTFWRIPDSEEPAWLHNRLVTVKVQQRIYFFDLIAFSTAYSLKTSWFFRLLWSEIYSSSWHQLIDLDLPCTQGVSGLLYSVDSTLKVYSIPAYLVYTQFVLRFARILQVNIFPGNCSYNAARPDLYGVGSGIPDPEKCCQNGEKQPGWGMVKAIDLRAYFLVRSMFAFRKSLLANLCAAAGAAVYFQFSSAAMQTFTKANSQNFQKLKTIMNNKWYCKTNVSQ